MSWNLGLRIQVLPSCISCIATNGQVQAQLHVQLQLHVDTESNNRRLNKGTGSSLCQIKRRDSKYPEGNYLEHKKRFMYSEG